MEAYLKLEKILLEYGLSDDDIVYLLAQYLEEEAQLYIDCMKTLKERTN